MERRHSWPAGHWDWPIKVTHKHGLRCGPMIYLGGQVDLDGRGNVLHPGDLATQTAAAMRHIRTILEDLGAGLADLVKLQAFYVNDGSVEERAFLARIAAALPAGSAVVATAIPVPYLSYPGLMVEIEAVAMRGEDGTALERRTASPKGIAPLPPPLVHGVRCGEMIFIGGQAPRDAGGALLLPDDIVGQSRLVMDRIGAVLTALGAGFGDMVKINRWYAGAGTREDWEPAALAVAACFPEPGPVATGIPLPRHADAAQRIMIDGMAMRGADGAALSRRHVWPEGHWDWPVHLPYKHGLRCGNMVFIGGQVAIDSRGEVQKPDALAVQTRMSLDHIRRVLAGFGLDMDSVVKVLTLYSAAGRSEELHTNLSIRSAAFTEPGPATTGIPLPALAYRGMMIEIEIIAMAS